MKKLIRFPNQQRAEEQACDWIARLDRGLSEGERRAFELWLRDSINKEVFADTAALWDEMDIMSELEDLFPLQPPRLGTRFVRWLNHYRAGIAAGITVLIIGSAVLVAKSPLLVPKPSSTGAAVVAQTQTLQFETPVGGFRSEQLEDTSVITLNTDTDVRVQFSPTSRGVNLRRGQANFQVAHDAKRPFVVDVGQHTIQAVGTAFDVRRRSSDRFDLIVSKGKVLVQNRIANSDATDANDSTSIAARRQPVSYVSAGEIATFEGENLVVRSISARDMQARLAWQQGMLGFQGETLNEVLEEVGRYSVEPIILSDNSLGEIRVAGYFPANDIEALLLALRNNFQIDYQRRDGQIILSAR